MTLLPRTPAASTPSPALRPVRASDREAMRRYLHAMSDADRWLRFHGGVKPDAARLLDHLTLADGTRHVALVAVVAGEGGERIVGEACFVRPAGQAQAEFAISVAAEWQGRGLAGALLRELARQAAAAGVPGLVGEVLPGNRRMAAFLRREGYALRSDDGDTQRWQRTLAAPRTAPAQRGARWAGWLQGLRRRLLAAAQVQPA